VPIRPIEPEQRSAARVVGVLYLVLMVTGVFAEFYARGRAIVPGDAVQTARNIAASERLFRLGIVSDLVTFAGGIALVWALYVVLRPVDRNLALLGAFWRLAECSVLAVITVNDFAALRLLGGAEYLRAVDETQLQVLARVFLGVQSDGYRIGIVLFGLGSAVFGYLWFRSRYIPRWLAAWGIFAALLVAVVTLTVMVFPALTPVVTPFYYAPIFLFEVGLGLWLLTRGIRSPAAP
jgi:uncharacterized protein DUF4386